MGLRGSHQLSDSNLAAHRKATGLSMEQLEQLNTRFRALDRRQCGYLTSTELLRIPQLAQNPLHRQIIDGFFADEDNTVDASNTSPSATSERRIGFDQFARICAVFLVPQYIHYPAERADGRAQKLRMLSKMFDTQRCGCIQRTDFHRAMMYLLDSVPPSDGVANANQQSSETELQRLEELTFANRQSITYEEFEDRLATTDVEGRLAIHKWLDED